MFLEQILIGLAFPEKYVRWIMSCIQSVSYSILLNGKPIEPFEAKNGLRQGDPMPPFLFVLAVEYLNRSLKILWHIPDFNYHPRYDKLKITQIGFADDLLLFCRGDTGSVKLLYECFKKFSKLLDLQLTKAKALCFLGGEQRY